MFNAKDVVTAARAGEAIIAEAAPGFSESVARSLPEIFGPAGKHSAKAVEAFPGAGQAIERISAQFQGMLDRFGLTHDAGPAKLYDAAVRAGEHPALLQSTGGRHVASSKEIAFSDGSKLSYGYGAGRSGVTKTHTFRISDGTASITEHHSNFFGRANDTIGVHALDFKAEANIAR